jgi:phosphohistidine swiveling domain-containing protein
MEISYIVNKIKRYLKREDRKDVEFRALLALTQLGDVAKYITHDPKLNPNARAHGTKSDETLAYGQVLVQTIASMILRKIDIRKALELGLENWHEADWRRREKKQKVISGVFPGILANSGNAQGKAYVLSQNHPLEKMPKGAILVAELVTPSMVSYLSKTVGIIADQGGNNSHAAIMSREKNIPCIVGTGNATVLIPHGKNIKILSLDGKGLIQII